ncbi:MAG: hypothetical protein R8K46_03925 [Mariprofundaceae bacterium]
MVHVEVGIGFLESEQSVDVALDSCQAHQAVVPLIKEATISRTVVNYDA